MIVALHVLIALTSVCLTAYTYIVPSRAKLNGSYALLGLTLASGTYLVWSTQTRMLQSCIMGLAFMGITLLAIVLARSKLVHATARNK